MFLKTWRQLISQFQAEAKKVVFKTATATLGVYEQHCRVTTASTGAAVTITLPPPASCFGLYYFVKLVTKDTYDVTVSGGGSTLGTLDTTGDSILVVSTGHEFVPIGGTYT